MSKKLLKHVVVLLVLVLLFSELAPEPYPLNREDYFVVGFISDTHFGGWIDPRMVATALHKLSSEADIVVFTGDLTETHKGNRAEFTVFRQVANKYLSLPWKAVPGNHDWPPLFEKYAGDLQWIWDIEGYRLVGLNSRTRKIDFKFLEQTVRSSPYPVLVFSHHNPLMLFEKDRLSDLLLSGKIACWSSGHLHFQWERLSSTTVFVQGGWGLVGKYQLVCFKDGKVAKVIFR